jgi:uncharacterized protein (DUF1778 family)
MIGIRLEPELKDLLQKVAKEERRSLSNFMVHSALTYLKEHKDIDWLEDQEAKASKKPKK